MAYEDFLVKNFQSFKICANAKKFGVESLQNDDLVEILLNANRIELSDQNRKCVAEIFIKLMKIEEEVQLSN